MKKQNSINEWELNDEDLIVIAELVEKGSKLDAINEFKTRLNYHLPITMCMNAVVNIHKQLSK